MIWLAYELQEYIISFLPFEKTLNYPFTCKQKYRSTFHTWVWAAENGHLDVVKWLHVNRTDGYKRLIMILAAYNGHLDIVEWLSDNRTEGCKF